MLTRLRTHLKDRTPHSAELRRYGLYDQHITDLQNDTVLAEPSVKKKRQRIPVKLLGYRNSPHRKRADKVRRGEVPPPVKTSSSVAEDEQYQRRDNAEAHSAE